MRAPANRSPLPSTSPLASGLSSRLLTVLLLAVSVATPSCAQDDGKPVALVEAVNAFPAQERFDRPLLVEFTPTDPDHAYVVVQPGQVFRVPRDGTAGERTTFLDLAGKVYLDNWEEGLLGFAFDPAYAQNGYVYVCYSEQTEKREGEVYPGRKAASTRQSVIARYATKMDGDGPRTVDADSELRLLTVFQPFGNHNGGTIVFGPDGMLYVALGDGGAANDPFGTAQHKGSLLGKVLRIDVRGATKDAPYAIPADNPFVGVDGARGEIWTYGMRNPWRIAFDRKTGELWCGDVGQNRIEEVDRLEKGRNYGWNFMEGTERFRARRGNAPMPEDLVPPIAEYPHEDGLSITGGHVYRGAKLPKLEGFYVYGDFATFRLWAVREDRAGGRHQVLQIGRAPAQISSFAEEPDGELLMTCFDGRVYRLVPR